MKMGGMCFNWKVVAGLAAVGLGLWAAAPNLAMAALPFLLMAACPLSMFLMMRGMGGGPCSTQPTRTSQQEGAGQPAGTGLARDERLAELQSRLADVQRQHETIAREIACLEAEDAPAARQVEAGRGRDSGTG